MLYGLVVAFAGWGIVRSNLLKEVRAFYAKLLSQFELSVPEVIFISLCAGIGEELLFRGAIQPWLGVELTAFIFVAIHGYLDPRDWRISLYGLFMTLAIIGIGYMSEAWGLVSAMTAHTVIDIVLLHMLVVRKLGGE